MKRGIISNIGKITKVNNGVGIGFDFSQNDFNYQILYWDKIVIPDNNLFGCTLPNEEELIKCGILHKPMVQFSSFSTNNSDISYNPFIVAQSTVANELFKTEKDIDWTIHHMGEEVAIGYDLKQEFNSIKVELLNCLPVPNEKIHFEKILEFKEKMN